MEMITPPQNSNLFFDGRLVVLLVGPILRVYDLLQWEVVHV
jgi:hypothetical protein